MLAQFDSAALQAVARASKRSSALVHEGMREGVYSLATIACLAPWVGLFGTILGIVNSFQGISGERWSNYAAICEGLSEAMWPTGLGLLVGLIAFWSYEYLAGQLRALDQEMENASLELLNQLSRFRAPFTTKASINNLAAGPMFGERPLAELSRDEKFRRRSMFLAGTALVTAWFVQALRLPAEAAFLYVPLMFGLSCLAMYPVWAKLLHRRSGGLAALGAGFCLCWTLAELVSGVSLP